MTFRSRILAAMVPLFLLLIVLGATGTLLIYHLGRQVDDILHDNYDSIVYMRDLNEALERIDSSFQFALAGKEKQSFDQYQKNWALYQDSEARERGNVTVRGERDLVVRLTDLSQRYRKLGEAFFKSPAGDRDALYFGKNKDREDGLYATFRQIKVTAGDILNLNQKNMFDVDDATKKLARRSLVWYSCGLFCGIVLAVFLTASTIRTIMAPVRAVTESATAIGAGNLDQVVPITSDDELGRLATAFNAMARQLRDYRQSHEAQLIRAADQPGDDRLVSGAGAGGRLGAPRGDGQSGGAAAVRSAAARGGRRSPRYGSRPRPSASRCPPLCGSSACTSRKVLTR